MFRITAEVYKKWPILLGVLGTIFIGVISSMSYLATFLLIGLISIIITGYLFLHRPHICLIFFGIFLLLQDLIVDNVSSGSIVFGKVVKNIDEVFILLCFLLLLLGVLTKAATIVKTHIELPLLGFIGAGVLSTVVSRVPLYIASVQFFLYIKGFLLFFILANLPISEIQLKKYVKSFLFISICIFCLGLVDLIVPVWFRSITRNAVNVSYRVGIPSVVSIFRHPDVFGWFMSFIGLYAFAFFIIFNKIRYLIFGLLFSFGTLISMRTKSLGGLVGGLFAGLWPCGITKKIKYGLLFLFIGVLVFIPLRSKFKGVYHIIERTYVKVEDHFQEARNALYITSFKIAEDCFPLGVGLGRYGSWMSRVYYSPVYDKYGLSKVHGLSRAVRSFINDTFWPMILGETGILGLFFYLWIIILLCHGVYKKIKLADSKYVKAFTLGTFMVLIESLIESLVHPVYTSPPKVYFIFGSLGIVYALKLAKRKNELKNG